MILTLETQKIDPYFFQRIVGVAEKGRTIKFKELEKKRPTRIEVGKSRMCNARCFVCVEKYSCVVVVGGGGERDHQFTLKENKDDLETGSDLRCVV